MLHCLQMKFLSYSLSHMKLAVYYFHLQASLGLYCLPGNPMLLHDQKMECHGVLDIEDLLKCFAKDQFPVLSDSGLNSKTPVLKP